MAPRTVTLNDGKQMPLLAWGASKRRLYPNMDLLVQTGVWVLDAGLHYIDTAQLYETEEEVGRAVKQSGLSKDKIFITTKLSENDVKETTPAAIKAAVEGSIRKMGFKPDLLLIHNPFVIEKGKIGEAWQILEALVEDGTLGGISLGVSNFRPQDLKAVLDVARIKPAVHQLEYHPYVLNHLAPVLAIHAEHNIVTQAFGPLTPLLRHPTGGPIKPILERIAKSISAESGQEADATTVLLLWSLSQGDSAVTTTQKEARIKKLGTVDNLRDLTKDEIEEITTAGKKVHFRHYREHMEEDFPIPDLPSDA